MLVNVIYCVHVCEQARWARSAGNSAIENVCVIILLINILQVKLQEKEKQHQLTLADLHRQKEELLRKHTALATELDEHKTQSTELEAALHQWGKQSFAATVEAAGVVSAYGCIVWSVIMLKGYILG